MSTGQGSRGVTLPELCVGIAVVAILAGLAVPGMRAALRQAAMRSATLELVTGLQQARASAIVQARTGVLCLSDEHGECLAGATTATSWAAFLEGRGMRTPLASGALPRGLELHATRPRLNFWPDSLAASTGTLTICDRAALARPRAMIVSQTGRVRLTDVAEAACRA